MDNRANLLTCALTLFASQGFDSIGVQKIVETAGVTKPTLYHYFKSKYGLLEALLEEHYQELARLTQHAAEYRGDLSLTLSGIAGAYFGFARDHAEFYRLQLSLYFLPPDHQAHQMTAQYLEKQHRSIEQVFIQAVKEYTMMRDRHPYYTAIFLGMVDHWISLALNGYVELNSALVHQTVQQFLYGIHGQPTITIRNLP